MDKGTAVFSVNDEFLIAGREVARDLTLKDQAEPRVTWLQSQPKEAQAAWLGRDMTASHADHYEPSWIVRNGQAGRVMTIIENLETPAQKAAALGAQRMIVELAQEGMGERVITVLKTLEPTQQARLISLPCVKETMIANRAGFILGVIEGTLPEDQQKVVAETRATREERVRVAGTLHAYCGS